MTNCILLGDDTVNEILNNLSRAETITFLDRVATTIQQCTGKERSYQPDPTIVRRDDGRRVLFRTFTSPTDVGVKTVVDLGQVKKPLQPIATSSGEDKHPPRINGVLTLCNEYGFLSGILNAAEITGFRTSLCAMILYMRRQKTANMVVFGAGKQALWHIRLALALRGHEIKRLTVVNRSLENVQTMLASIKQENESRWKSQATLDSIQIDDTSKLEEVLGQADAVFCTTASQKPLFPSHFLQISEEGSCYVSAVGSWQSDMIELDPKLLKTAAERDNGAGIVVADEREDCLKNSGELVQSNLKAGKIIELGEVLGMASDTSSESGQKTASCLETGLVVYKSVGLAIMDLAAGQAILEIARKKNVGMSVPGF